MTSRKQPDARPGPGRGPTARDVAQAAGVSVAVVSYAFNRPDRVATATRERVLATAAAMGYRGPDPAARALRLGRRGAVALRGPGSIEALLADPAAALVARGLAGACDRAGVALTLTAHPGPAVDGTVLFRAGEAPGAGALVVVDPAAPSLAGSEVRADVAAGAAAAARHLRDLGHRDLAVLTWAQAGARLEGARAGWAGAGPLHVVMAPGARHPHGVLAAGAALGRRPRPTAVLALTDGLALGALEAAERAGLGVPGDLSVAGVDDLPGADAAGLTTVFVPYRPMGELAGGILAALVEGQEPPPAPALPTGLVIRRTTGPPTPPRP